MATRPTRSTGRRAVRSTAGRTPVMPASAVKRTGLSGKRGSSIAEKAVENAGLMPKVAGQSTFTGRKPPSSLIPPIPIEIGPNTTHGSAPIPERVHQPKRPKDTFVDQGRLPKRKR